MSLRRALRELGRVWHEAACSFIFNVNFKTICQAYIIK
jgi:hypothetical protein